MKKINEQWEIDFIDDACDYIELGYEMDKVLEIVRWIVKREVKRAIKKFKEGKK